LQATENPAFAITQAPTLYISDEGDHEQAKKTLHKRKPSLTADAFHTRDLPR